MANPKKDQEAKKQTDSRPETPARALARAATAPAQTAPAAAGPITGAEATRYQKLADLLRRYRDYEIGPAEYHSERASILAEP
jgi:hypothetical protein